MIYWGLHTLHRQIALLLVLLLTLVLSGFAKAAIQLEQCGQDALDIHSALQAYVDPTAAHSVTDIQRLPQKAWRDLDKSLLAPGLSRAAYWYRVTVNNPLGTECRLWLDLNTLQVTDLQVFSRSAGSGQWQVQRAGAAYPFAEWASAQRVPSIPISMPAAGSTEIMLRISSSDAIAIAPELLSQQNMIKKRMTEGLVDGVIFGVVALLVVFSVLVGYFFRLKILLAHAAAVLLYTLYLSLVAGYGFVHLWPNAVFFNAQVVMSVGLATRIMLLVFMGQLLLLSSQAQGVRRFMAGAQFGLLSLLGLRLVFPASPWLADDSLVNGVLHLWAVLAIGLALYTGRQKKLPYAWFSYFMALVVIAELAVFILHSVAWSVLAAMQYPWLSVSAIPAALFLSYTLVSKLICIRQRERRVLADFEQLKRAEQESLEQRVELRTTQLRNALRNQNMLLARIGHDLRAPIQHVVRDAALLQQSSEQAGRYGHSIQRAAHQQLELIDELLEYSRGELKQLELLIAPGYLFGFLREIEESGVFLAERNNNSFVSNLDDTLPLLVNADFRRLRQVIMNLLANASKFTKQGLIEFSVDLVHLDKQAGYADVQFTVSDNGIGIPEAERENLLQPFQRGASSANYTGMGLGLYIVRQLLDSMHSQLAIDTSASGGVRSHFTLRLELAAEHELEQVFIESYSHSSQGQQRCVLIVDDVEIAQEMLYELLAGYDYNPLVCSSAAEALVILREHPVDMIITDQVMPIMDGWDLLRKVREEWPQLPVLLYSARPPVRPQDLETTIKFDACLLKPAATSDLLAQIKALLDSAQQ